MSLPTFKVNAWGWRLLIFGGVCAAIFYFKLWQPRRQIELHQKNFLLALEDRNWRRVRAELSENYADRFGYRRDTAVKDLREVLRQFFALSIRSQGTQWKIGPEEASVTANLTLSGTGTAATEFISNEANRLPEPWVFTWRKESFWPWDWRLVQIENVSLTLRENRSF